MAPLYFVPRSPLRAEPRLSLVSVFWKPLSFRGRVNHPTSQCDSLLLFDERVEGLPSYNQGISNVFGYFPSS